MILDKENEFSIVKWLNEQIEWLLTIESWFSLSQMCEELLHYSF